MHSAASVPKAAQRPPNMTADNMEPQEMDESGLPGPGAPTPLSALEVSDSVGDILLDQFT